MCAMTDAAAPETGPAFDARGFRNALGTFATGVTVITTRGEDHDYGMTANAFSSVSLDPPLVLICVASTSQGCDVIQRVGAFAVNVLSDTQEPLSRYFASKDRPRGRDAFRDVDHRLGVTGAPLLDGVVAHLDCRLHSSYTVGDHEVFIGEVMDLFVNPDAEPLQMTIGLSDGERLYAVRYASGPVVNTLHVSQDIEALRRLYPADERFAHFGDEARVVVSEPLIVLPGLWHEVPPSSALVIQKGPDEERPFRPQPPA
jgi:flavin reductase (DIM6/NTAB) family NADH-FMN oxidoreductase RutF